MKVKFFLVFVYTILMILYSSCKTDTKNELNKKNNISIVIKNNHIEVFQKNINSSNDTLIYYFPKTISGTYHENTSLISDSTFFAFDANNNKLPVKKIGKNKFIISNARKLKSLYYKINRTEYNTFNLLSKGLIISDNLVVLNCNVLIGSFSKDEHKVFSIEIKKNKKFDNISNKNVISINDSIDKIEFDNYEDLINSPIIYSSTYNSITDSINNLKFNIYTHPKQDNISKIEKIVSPVIKSVFKELAFLNPKEYTFTFIFNTKVKPKILDYAALEHPNSSVYLMFSSPYFTNKEDSAEFCLRIKHIVAHEILHLFTPIAFKDYLIAKHSLSMSGHLWLYEGFVEYQSLKILLKNKIISQEEFFNVLEQKIERYRLMQMSGYKISLFDASKNILSKSSLSLFYNRATVLCFLLDIEISHLSKGQQDLFSVLKNIYSENSYFNEDSLFIKMNNITPGIANFTNKYIIGDTYPNIANFISKAGLSYSKVLKKYGYYFPIKIQKIKDNSVIISFYKPITPFKKDEQIELIEINNLPLSSYTFSLLYHRYLKNREPFFIKYLKDGKLNSTIIKPISVKVPVVPYYPKISVNKNMNFTQKTIYNKLFKQN